MVCMCLGGALVNDLARARAGRYEWNALEALEAIKFGKEPWKNRKSKISHRNKDFENDSK